MSLTEQGHHALWAGDSRTLSWCRHCCYPVLPAETSVPHTSLLLLLSTWWPSQVSQSVHFCDIQKHYTSEHHSSCFSTMCKKMLFSPPPAWIAILLYDGSDMSRPTNGLVVWQFKSLIVGRVWTVRSHKSNKEMLLFYYCAIASHIHQSRAFVLNL